MPALLSEGRRDTGAEADAPPTNAPSEADPPSPDTALVIAEDEEGYCSLFGTDGLLSRREEEEDVEGYWCWCCIRKGDALDKEAWMEADLGGGGCGGLARGPPVR